jgi:hypothetical protein
VVNGAGADARVGANDAIAGAVFDPPGVVVVVVVVPFGSGTHAAPAIPSTPITTANPRFMVPPQW